MARADLGGGQFATTGGAGGSAGFLGLGSAGPILSIAGALTGALGAFYSAKADQYRLRSQALDLEFESSIANINARQAELDAESIFEAGAREKALRTLQFGQVKGAARASQAARGIQAGVGSAAEVQASIDFARELDAFTIDANTVRAAGEARRRAVDQRNAALLSRVSAQNIRSAAGSISPGLAAAGSLLGSAPLVASQFAAFERRRIG